MEDIVSLISQRLETAADQLSYDFHNSGNTKFSIIDDLLPLEVAERLASQFPDKPETIMSYKSSIRERKYSTNQLHKVPESLRNLVLAFEDERTLDIIRRITGFHSLVHDSDLYAGGISEMHSGHFVLPHIDNSHNYHRTSYRALNLLFYLSKDWPNDAGGNLILWPDGLGRQPLEVISRFNRLVIMETSPDSWHAVNPVCYPGKRRCLFYSYFRPEPMIASDYFHVTSMRAWPGRPIMDWFLVQDIRIRMLLRWFFPKGMRGEKVIWKR